jgi:UPF0755 protein
VRETLRPAAAERGRGQLAAALALVLLSVLGAAAAAWVWVARQYQAPGPAGAVSRVQVEPGVSLRSVLARLESGGSVRNARAVQWYLRLHGMRPRVQAGLYELPAHASPAQIISLFEQGKVVLEQLTVVEGATFDEFIEALNQHPYVQHTLSKGETPNQVMAALGHPGLAAEGEFFPDTYRFAANTPDIAILSLAYDAMQRAIDVAWQSRATDLPFDTPYQALILASIIEKEAALKSERGQIAGVFVNRLRKGMRLQSDPTVIYGLGERYDGSIHTRDLATDNPYNTYTRAGLPPTPIALPGRESLMAAVHPEETGALYFVATGRGDGAHHFSRTLEEHNSAVKSYLMRLREQQRDAARKPQTPPVPAISHAAVKAAGQGAAHP